VLTAFVLIDCDPGLIPEVATQVANLKGVSECYSVAGDADLIAIVRVRDHHELADVIADGVSKVGGVAHTKTMIAFRTYSNTELEQAFALGLE